MERTYAIERAAHARAVAAAKGKRIGWPSVVDPAKLAYAAHLRDQEDQSISEIVQATGITAPASTVIGHRVHYRR